MPLGATQEEEEGAMRIEGVRAIEGTMEGNLAHTKMIDTLNTTLTMGTTRATIGSHRPQGLEEEAQGQLATQEGIESKTLDMVIAQEEMNPEAEGKMNIDRMEIIGVIEARAEKGGAMGQIELDVTDMAADKGGGPENTARRLQTWGILLQATPQMMNQDLP